MQTLRFALLSGLLALTPARAAVTITHVHGLSYSPDGKQLVIPSHHGLAVYEDGKWSKAPGAQHDYMGYAATGKNLYSSGHPAPGSGMVNPFGVIRSKDGGKTWEQLGLEGETDFHLMAASWSTNAVYVWNPAPSSRMPQLGLHYTVNDGLAWKPARARAPLGAGKPANIPLPALGQDAVAYIAQNPAQRSEYAIATFERSVYVSRDAGQTWTPIALRGNGQ